MSEGDNPMDQLNVQLPGRLMTLELLVTLLLREKANKGRLLNEAESRLDVYEAAVHADRIGQSDGYALQLFAIAREQLDAIRARVKGD